jgi:hypothetical protein
VIKCTTKVAEQLVLAGTDCGTGVMQELMAQSAHRQAIVQQMESMGDAVRQLGDKVSKFRPDNMDAVVQFADTMDSFLSHLEDENEVCRRLLAPEVIGKIDTIRQSASEYLQLQEMQKEMSGYQVKAGEVWAMAGHGITQAFEKVKRHSRRACYVEPRGSLAETPYPTHFAC